MFNVLKMLLNSDGMGICRLTLSDFLSTYKKCYLLNVVDSFEVQFRVVSLIVKLSSFCDKHVERFFFQ